MGLIKLKNICTAKENKQNGKTTLRMEENIGNEVMDRD